MLRGLVAVLILVIATCGAQAEKRVALVIGNAGYNNAAPLKNPVNDATDLSKALERLDFKVVTGIDVDHEAMRRKVKEFTDIMVDADVAVFFYAGHAVQVGGENYLAPVDTDLQKESDLDFETVSLNLVRRQMEREAKTLIIFLDACRDNPLTRRLVRRSRSTGDSKGLARFDTSGEGTFIAFATQPDNVALDGEGRNSPFTTALLDNIERPGVEISALMTDVRRSVYETTSGQQLPWTNSSLLGQFYFKAPQAGKTGSGDQDARLAKLEADARAWLEIRDSNDPARIREVLGQLVDGPYAELARARLDLLEGASQQKSDASPQQEDSQSVKLALAEPPKVREEPAEPVEPSRELVRSIQQELQRVGCNPGSADGLWGRQSRSALGEFSRHGDVELATLEPSQPLLDSLKERSGRVCPLQCGRGQVEKNGVCVATAQPSKPTRTKTVTKRPSSSSCFRFNGQLVCD